MIEVDNFSLNLEDLVVIDCIEVKGDVFIEIVDENIKMNNELLFYDVSC